MRQSKAEKKAYRKRWLLTPAGKAYLRTKHQRRYARPDVRAKILKDSAEYQRREKGKRSEFTKRWRTTTEAGQRYYSRNRYELPVDAPQELVEAYAALAELNKELARHGYSRGN